MMAVRAMPVSRPGELRVPGAAGARRPDSRRAAKFTLGLGSRGSSVAAAAAGLSLRACSRRAWKSAAPASDRPCSFDDVLKAYMDASRGVSPQDNCENWVSHGVCPKCHGGVHKEKSLSMISTVDGAIICKCWRMNKCGKVWSVRPKEWSKLPIDSQAPFRFRGQKSAPPPAKSEFHAQKTVPLLPEHQEYMVQERCIPQKILERHQIASCARSGAVVFPFVHGGEVVSQKFRAVKEKKFWQAKGGQKCLFGVDDLLGQPVVCLTEGEIDKLSVEAAGMRASASLQHGAGGGLAKMFGAGEALASAERVVLAMDGDEAGQEAMRATAKELGFKRCYQVNWPEGRKDANDVLQHDGAAALKRLIDDATPVTPPWKTVSFKDEANLNYVKDVIAGNVDPKFRSGVSTGWPGVDKIYRVVPGEVTVVTGVPGSGKSEWLLSLLANMAAAEAWRFLLFTFEATQSSLTVQLATKVRTLKPHQDDKQIVDWLDDHFELGVDDYGDSPTMDQMLETAKRVHASNPLQGIVIDPYNYITRDEVIEHHFIGNLMGRLRKFAEEAKVHIWIVAHPTKSTSWNSEKPTLYSIAGSSNWINKTDMGIIIHRRTLEDNGEVIPTRQVQVIVEKVRNREAGKIGEALLVFERETRSYGDCTHLLNADESSFVAPTETRARTKTKVVVDHDDETDEDEGY